MTDFLKLVSPIIFTNKMFRRLGEARAEPFFRKSQDFTIFGFVHFAQKNQILIPNLCVFLQNF
nr:MAG TPA: hypothetical protein [Caudoviricetes sp.]